MGEMERHHFSHFLLNGKRPRSDGLSPLEQHAHHSPKRSEHSSVQPNIHCGLWIAQRPVPPRSNPGWRRSHSRVLSERSCASAEACRHTSRISNIASSSAAACDPHTLCNRGRGMSKVARHAGTRAETAMIPAMPSAQAILFSLQRKQKQKQDSFVHDEERDKKGQKHVRTPCCSIPRTSRQSPR